MSSPGGEGKDFLFCFNHIFLPRFLPGSFDCNNPAGINTLFECLIEASSLFDRFAEDARVEHWPIVSHSFLATKSVYNCELLDQHCLQSALSTLRPGCGLFLHVEAQNAGLLITRQAKDVLFEAFEASAACAAVLNSDNCLEWDFPKRAVTMPLDSLQNAGFVSNICAFLERASQESIKQFAAKTEKAGSLAFEVRDTADPSMITDMLMSLLQADGSSTGPIILRKHVRDEVRWQSGAVAPWRRSPLWLVLRVGLQRLLHAQFGGVNGQIYYKLFVAFFMTRICRELRGLGTLDLEIFSHSRAKLAGRLAKLEIFKKAADTPQASAVRGLSRSLEPIFERTISLLDNCIDTAWSKFKERALRTIPIVSDLVSRADLVLPLSISRSHLETAQTAWHDDMRRYRKKGKATELSSAAPPPHAPDWSPNAFVIAEIKRLQDFEDQVKCRQAPYNEPPPGSKPSMDQLIKIGEAVKEYQESALLLYGDSAEMKSTMILTVIELWVLQDKLATARLPLLRRYSPELRSDMTHDLSLPRLEDMRRLAVVESHMDLRNKAADKALPSIFSDPEPRCFANQFFDSCAAMKAKLEAIWEESECARKVTEADWKELSEKYRMQQSRIASIYCDSTKKADGEHDRGPCQRCKLIRTAFIIKSHEEPLPRDKVISKAVIFELDAPEEFHVWRNTTWRILRDLPRLPPPHEGSPRIILYNYSPLTKHGLSGQGRLTLASSSKPVMDTHLRDTKFPVELEKVCFPNGMSFSLFDFEARVWITKPNPRWTFSGLIPVTFAMHPNEIIAKQNTGPKEWSVLESMAIRDLQSQQRLQWYSTLRELASSNLNFSTKATCDVLSKISSRVGSNYDGNVLRDAHRVFHDLAFCITIMEQIDARVESIKSNWKESPAMETLLTLAVRVFELGPLDCRPVVLAAIIKIRRISMSWIRSLRTRIHKNSDTTSSEKRWRDAYAAAAICRRTCTFATPEWTLRVSDGLQSYLESSLHMDQSAQVEYWKMDLSQKNVQLRDWKLAYAIRHDLREKIANDKNSLERAIQSFWPLPEGDASRKFSQWSFEQDGWAATRTIPTTSSRSQTVHFNFIFGTLLVDSTPLGRLPETHSVSDALERLFGSHALTTFPSSMPGMSHTLTYLYKGHQIHFGDREGVPIIRAVREGKIMEYIPYQCFKNSHSQDFPRSLVDGCFHWLDLKSACLQIRTTETAWNHDCSPWVVDLETSTARRADFPESHLISPQSQTFKQMETILRHFEHPDWFLVYKTSSNKVVASLPRLELDFQVRPDGRLYAVQLDSLVDLNQDIGTFYGFASKLVLHDARNDLERSIVFPLRKLYVERDGVHVKIGMKSASSAKEYCRFTVNEVIGRLECPVEPKLFFLKALLHAYTSSVVPDPLTGRTGTEEALHCLSSASAQVWKPLSSDALHFLLDLASLSPSREFYPGGLRVMEKVTWQSQLTPFIQQDYFQRLVRQIIRSSDELCPFFDRPTMTKELSPAEESQLACRSRGSIVISHVFESRKVPKPYLSRPLYHESGLAKRKAVFEVAKVIKSRPPSILTLDDVAKVIQSWPSVGGSKARIDDVLLTDILNMKLSEKWVALYQLCRSHSQVKHAYKMIFFLSILAFGHHDRMGLVRLLCAFCTFKKFAQLDPPVWEGNRKFEPGKRPSLEMVSAKVENAAIKYPGDERLTSGRPIASRRRNKLEHLQKAAEDCQSVAKHLFGQWPNANLSVCDLGQDLLVDIGKAVCSLTPEWLHLCQNHDFELHIRAVQHVLDKHRGPSGVSAMPESTGKAEYYARQASDTAALSLHKLLKMPCDDPQKQPGDLDEIVLVPDEVSFEETPGQAARQSSPEVSKLQTLVKKLSDGHNAVRSRYAKDLELSINALMARRAIGDEGESSVALLSLNKSSKSAQERVQSEGMAGLALLDVHLNSMQERAKNLHAGICEMLSREIRFKWLSAGHLWPRITPSDLIASLCNNWGDTGKGNLFRHVIQYVQALARHQRLLRLRDTCLKKDMSGLKCVILPEGQSLWDAHENPQWLALEVDSNISIRPKQVDVARAMISPPASSNAVMQLNMGEGKSSVIIPMVVAALSTKESLLRIVVPKALLSQMAQVLQTRVSGLLGQRVKHVPFSRRTSTSYESISAYHGIHEDMLQNRGVMLVLPEHLLSFKLSGLQRLLDGKLGTANQMLSVQEWLNSSSRDVLDESDHTLAVRTQLVYPSGDLNMVDGHPHRWLTIQMVLKAVLEHVFQIHRECPSGIEVVARSDERFPVIYFLQKQAEDQLINRLVEGFCGSSSMLPLNGCSTKQVFALKNFISQVTVTEADRVTVLKMFPESDELQHGILLLRGLLVERILIMALNKRWNVQYGLDPERDPIAVPYLAKGVPSSHSEWGHPDVAILFTCLSFYYQGLNRIQLRECLEQILKTDDPESEYARWTADCSSLPGYLKRWQAINIEDDAQLVELWKHLQNKVSVTDYYMNNFVFPRHAKQFSRKLQASGWDIPLFQPSRETQPAKSKATKDVSGGSTTGFSGTNDNRMMLPLSIQQQDLPSLIHTNAEVLTYLLSARNSSYQQLIDKNGKRLTERGFLRMLKHQGIRMLIDAGAQVLEMDNQGLVTEWMRIDATASAAVFFNAEDQACIYRRDGRTLPLIATRYADDLSGCLVYLDEAHTRGTDLRMPVDSKGALTLGPGQTKDHTVQAAMRLRLLRSTQSLAFFAPIEVHQSILDVRNKTKGDVLDSSDVVYWLLEQTCQSIEKLQPLYISQGADFCRRAQAALDYDGSTKNPTEREAYLQLLEKAEAQTLKQLYAPEPKQRPSGTARRLTSPELMAFNSELYKMHTELQRPGMTAEALAFQEVEQERDVTLEVERVEEVEIAPPPNALPHKSVHEDVVHFAKSGRATPTQGPGYKRAFGALAETATGAIYGIRVPSLKLFATTDFSSTVSEPRGQKDDRYQRPVQWILWSPRQEAALIISPHEAAYLLPIMRDDPSTKSHLLIYAAPATRKMLQLNGLNLYAIPALPKGWRAPLWLRVALGIFAGRLFFEFEEYELVKKFLGYADHQGSAIQVRAGSSGWTEQQFTAKPLVFMHRWLSARRKEQDFTWTPMGFVIQGKALGPTHRFFQDASDEADEVLEEPDIDADAGEEGEDSDTASEDESDAVDGDAAKEETDDDAGGDDDD